MNSEIGEGEIIATQAIPSNQEVLLSYPALSCQLQRSTLTCLVGPHRIQLRAYLQMLAGIAKPAQGEVNILGQSIAELEQSEWQRFRCKIGYLSGKAQLLSVQHGLMNVMLPALYHTNLPFAEVAAKARALLAELACDFNPTIYPAQLNSYQLVLLALARALILDPPVLFLDAPFSDLGALERKQMAALLAEYKPKHTMCMLGGLQYTRFLEQHATQIIFISENSIVHFNGWDAFKQTNDAEVSEFLSIL